MVLTCRCFLKSLGRGQPCPSHQSSFVEMSWFVWLLWISGSGTKNIVQKSLLRFLGKLLPNMHGIRDTVASGRGQARAASLPAVPALGFPGGSIPRGPKEEG